jgi:peptide/nickel transport system substrate-binding protein
MKNSRPSGSPSRPVPIARVIRRGGAGVLAFYLFIGVVAPFAATAEQVGIPTPGGTLRVGITSLSTADALDPAMATTPGGYAIARQIFDTLTEFGSDGQLRMRLAESIVPDGGANNWIVTLHTARWQDGTPVTADDVIFTVKRILDPQAPLPPASSLSFIDPSRMTKLDDRTVRFELVYPTIAFADSFASPTLAIVPRGFNPARPIGSGPFKLEAIEPGTRVTFAANRAYWKSGEPLVDRLQIIGFPDSLSQVNALVGGQINIASSIDPILAPLIDRTGARLKVVEYPTAGTVTWQMNTGRKPFDDVRVRQALRLVVNRQQIIDQVYDGHATLGNDIFSPDDAAYDKDLPQREKNIAAAKQLLRVAGYPNGLRVVLTAAAIQPAADRQNEVLVQQAAKAGFDILVNTVDPASYYGDGYGTYPLSLSFWGQLSIFQQAAFTIVKGAPYDATHWHDSEYDALYQQALRTIDDKERVGLVHRMQAIEYERGPYVVAAFLNNVSGYDSRLMGYRPYPNCDGASGYNFYEIGFAPRREPRGLD